MIRLTDNGKYILAAVLVQEKCRQCMCCCCKLVFQLSPLHSVFNWKSACLPTCLCMPRPPTCLSFRSRSRWSGRASGWPESSSALFSSAASLLCSTLPHSDCLPLLMQHLMGPISRTHTHFFLNFLRQDFMFATWGQYKNSVTALILYFRQYASCSSIKGEIAPLRCP